MRAAVVLQQLHMHVGGPIFEQKVPPIPLFAELLKVHCPWAYFWETMVYISNLFEGNCYMYISSHAYGISFSLYSK